MKTLFKFTGYINSIWSCAFFLFILIAWSSNGSIGDFGNYYFGSSFWLNGNLTVNAIYEPYLFNLEVHHQGYLHNFLSYTQVPPFSLLFYLPFTVFTVFQAKLIWNFLNLFLLLFTLSKIHTNFKIEWHTLLLVLLIFTIPLLSNFQQGQSYLLIFFLLFNGFENYEKKQNWQAAAFWSLAILLKVFPAIILLFLLFNKSKDVFIKIVKVIAIVGFITTLFIGIAPISDYLFKILPRLSKGEITNVYAVSYQSMQVLLRTLFVPDQMHNATLKTNHLEVYSLLNLFYKVMIIVLCAAIHCNNKLKNFTKFSAWLLGGILISGYGTVYGLLMLLICVIDIINEDISIKKRNTILLLFALVCWIPIQYFSSLPTLLQFPRLFALLILFVLWLIYLKPVFKWQMIIPLLLILFTLLHKSTADDKYFFDKEQALLIYDFNFYNDSLQIKYFDQNGPQVKSQMLPLFIKKFESNETEPKHNRELIFSTENILKSMVVNDSQTLYLSDKHRGPGFYTLRIKNQVNWYYNYN